MSTANQNPTSINPLGRQVLVKLDEVKRQSAGGLYIPETAVHTNSAATGEVLAFGPDSEDERILRGVRVMFPKHKGIPVEDGGIKCAILDERDLLATLETAGA